MSADANKSTTNGYEKPLPSEEQQRKINEVRRLLGLLSGRLSIYCSDASIARHLRAQNWNVKKATKMLKETLKWRAEYKPEEIRWDEIANEAETGKIYRSNYVDKYGRAVLVMRPSCQNTKSTKGQIRYLVYCMENAILNLPPHQEQMVWLIDFQGFNLSHISVKVVKPFLELKTQNKVKFVYSDDINTRRIMEDLFDMDQLESAFGGNDRVGFNINKYAERMREDDKKMPSFWAMETTPSEASQPSLTMATSSDSPNLNSDSDTSDHEKNDTSSQRGMETEAVSSDEKGLTIDGSKNIVGEVH
ncbi:CRAL-TRIO domain-containing protein [Citrus sinensis]|uniref:CRAL-TRIO domain-containing protein n=1 Tax=Citrus sinensis TaxID=2711 RepID=A0ACB8KQH4_CITSI|nr:CRAL-TRIO domain-containing protein [Citrus sinensis]